MNEIDGASLLLLSEDFQEFQLLVPKGRIRMMIKSLVQNYSTGVCSTNLEVRSLSFYYDLVYESLLSMAKAYKQVYCIYCIYCVILSTLQP